MNISQSALGVIAKQTLALLVFCSTAAFVQADENDIVINEIMYHPPNDLENLQYVELFNRGQSTVDISNWSFTKGIKYDFPASTKLTPGTYLVVCRNVTNFMAQYGKEIPVVGNFSGKLSHHGDRLELVNAQKKVVESVKYSDHGAWPSGPDGHSSSLERICPQVAADRAENWAPSKLPTVKRPAGTPGKMNDNFSPSLPPLVSLVEFSPKTPAPQQKVTVTAAVADSEGVKAVTLFYRTAAAGRESPEKQIPMQRVSGDEKKGTYEAPLVGQPEGQLVRFRIKAVNTADAERVQPAENEPRPTYSYYTLGDIKRATIPLGFVLHTGRQERQPPYRSNVPRPAQVPVPTRGNGAFVFVPAGEGEAQIFDHVRVVPRNGGFKVHFQKDQTLKGMTTINVIFEQSPRWVLAEPLSYELYRMAGVPAELTDHVRIWMDGRLLGYHLLVEQPNQLFLARHQIDDNGNMYKLLWYGQDILGKHEKKTHLTTGHDDLIQLINGLNRKAGKEQWEFIQQNFNVEEVINYFAVNMCIQNWDGFWNNYFAYHDTGGTGKWIMLPWDEDKTWGDYDGASSAYDWYEMPLTYGMKGDQSSPEDARRFGGQGLFGGASWWRPPGYFSGPLLANPDFRKLFLVRLREVCTSLFTEEKMAPFFATMETRLEPEIRIRAEAVGENAQQALRTFRQDMQSFRNQVKNRRRFILAELNKTKQ